MQGVEKGGEDGNGGSLTCKTKLQEIITTKILMADIMALEDRALPR